MAFDVVKLEEKIDRVAAGGVAVSDTLGGIRFQNMLEVMEFSKMIAVSGAAIPPHLRGEPGACLAVCVQALEWRFSPFSVANKSYLVNNRIAYESQLIHAVIEARAPLTQRLRGRYEGEGDERVCIVSGHFRGEVDPVEYRSPPLGKIHPKNSPLWKTDSDQQLWFYSTRAWSRRYCPDILLGVFAKDELEDSNGSSDSPKDVTPGIKDRLPGARKGRGFSRDHVEGEAAKAAGETPKAASEPASDPKPAADTQSSAAATPAIPEAKEASAGTASPAAPPPAMTAVQIGEALIATLPRLTTVDQIATLAAEWDTHMSALGGGTDEDRQDQLELRAIIADHKARIREGGDTKAVEMSVGLRMRRIRDRASAKKAAA